MVTKSMIRTYMSWIMDDRFAPKSVEDMVREVAYKFEHPEWIKDPNHWVWEIAKEEFVEL